MILTIIISVIGIFLMMLCILKKPMIKIKDKEFSIFYLPVLLAALILVIFPIFDKNNYFNTLFTDSKLNPLKILTLFISVAFLSISLDESGFFSYLANKFIQKYSKKQSYLFFGMYLLISILTIFTSNDIVILTFTPFILYFCKRGNINPIPYLIMEFVAANTYSMLLPIGNPTNIYLTSIFDLPFVDYVLKMVIPAILVGLTSLGVILMLFRKELKKEIQVFETGDYLIKDKFQCYTSLIFLFLTTVMLVISNYINIEMWMIAFSSGLLLLIFLIFYALFKHEKKVLTGSLKRLPYNLIPFVLSMFTIIMALESFGVFTSISNLIKSINNEYLEKLTYLISSTLACNIINNIPMTIAFGSILQNTANLSFVYITIIGSNIGAILSPVGALAGIMWIGILKHNGVKYSFGDFMKNGSIITIFIVLVLSILIVFI